MSSDHSPQGRGCPVCFKRGPECRCGLPPESAVCVLQLVERPEVLPPNVALLPGHLQPIPQHYAAVESVLIECVRSWHNFTLPNIGVLRVQRNARNQRVRVEVWWGVEREKRSEWAACSVNPDGSRIRWINRA